jgi:hypothetical protein
VLRDRLAFWLDRAIDNGRFDVPSGRHIVLNDSPKLVRLARLQASAGVDQDTLIAFLTMLDPNVGSIKAKCCKELARDLARETGSMLALRVCESDDMAKAIAGRWQVYVPSLADLRLGRAKRLAAAAAAAPMRPIVPLSLPLPMPPAAASIDGHRHL